MSRSVTPLLLALCLFATPALAEDEGSARDKADRQQAEKLRAEAAAEFATIERDRLSGEAECAKKILVNRCRDQLHEALVERRKAVREKEIAASRLERAVKAREVAAREAEREAGRPARAEEQRRQARESETSRTVQQQDSARRQAEHNRRLLEAPERAKAEQANRAKRDAELANRRKQDAEEASARAAQAKRDKEHYEAKRREYEAKRAAKESGQARPEKAGPQSAPTP
ncbi:hypothetical protein [Niveibacterium microcysteis]|uniref:TolA protein n=1 Tax=Niveibacterium microcysteis TaxID=2811415 RepID=A0ABX7M987_9RHOO|nr:hypothetical protein [Niveibacterium microcysteis]QSI77035.1 hypothetical protein JY500_21745 [Niveibacterium microcysteis]